MKSNDPQKANVHMNVAKNENPVSDKQLQTVICNLTTSFDTLRKEVQEIKSSSNDKSQGNFSGPISGRPIPSSPQYQNQNASQNVGFFTPNMYPTGADQHNGRGQRGRGRGGYRGWSNDNTRSTHNSWAGQNIGNTTINFQIEIILLVKIKFQVKIKSLVVINFQVKINF